MTPGYDRSPLPPLRRERGPFALSLIVGAIGVVPLILLVVALYVWTT
jgi:hypothetical protein